MPPAPGPAAAAGSPRSAAVAAGRVWAAGLSLGGLGIVLSGFVVARLLVTWRVTPQGASHVSLLGQRLSYPVANADAVIVLALALVGLAVAAMTVRGAIRELAADRAFRQGVSAHTVRRLHGAWVIDGDLPQAFCAGLLRPCVYVSTGAVERLDETAVRAVLAHEFHHARRRDPLRLAVGRVLAGALFFVPGLHQLVRRHQDLAELGADEAAINAAPENRSALAHAMLTFAEPRGAGPAAGIDPQRVDHLLGEPPNWRFPAVVCVGAAGVLALAAGVAVLVGQAAAGSATLAPPFVSRQPCVVVLALLPAVCAMAAYVVRRARARRRAMRNE